jgi:hypothetical protein
MFDATIISKPSFYSLPITGILLFVSLLLIFQHSSKVGSSMSTYQLVNLLLLFSLAIGVHGLLHLGLEYVYNFNPLDYTDRKEK